MHPRVGEVDFHSVDVGDALGCEFLFYGPEYGIDVDIGCQLNFILDYLVCGLLLAKLADGFA